MEVEEAIWASFPCFNCMILFSNMPFRSVHVFFACFTIICIARSDTEGLVGFLMGLIGLNGLVVGLIGEREV